MDNFIDELMECGLDSFINMSMDKEIVQDECYKKHRKEAESIWKEFNELGMDIKTYEYMEKYISCIMSANVRACNLAYLVGGRNTLLLLKELGALKSLSDLQ